MGANPNSLPATATATATAPTRVASSVRTAIALATSLATPLALTHLDDAPPIAWQGDEQAATPPPRTFKRMTFADLKNLPRPTWLYRNLLLTNSVSVFYGPSGGHKTFIALDIACQLVMEGKHVLLLAREGEHGIYGRLMAWAIEYNGGRDLPGALEVITDCGDLFFEGEDTDTQALLNTILLDMPAPPDLIIIDTYSKHAGNADDNLQKDVRRVLRHLDSVRQNSKAHIMLIHHTNKGGCLVARRCSKMMWTPC